MGLITFEADVARILKAQGIKKKEIAALLNLDAGTVSRRFQKKPGFSREEIAKIDSFLGTGGTLLEKAGYRDEAPAFAGYVQEPDRAGFSGFSPAYWSYLLRGHLRDAPNENPVYAADFAGAVARQLEYDYRRTASKSRRQELKPLVSLARLIQANAFQNSLPTRQLFAPVDLARATIHLYPDDETLVFGTAIMFASSRMQTGHIGDIDQLERLERRTAKCSPYIASFFYEELARQHIASESATHTLEVIRADIRRGKEFCLLDRQVRERMAGLDDILGRAEWLKGKDPRKGAALLRHAGAQLETSAHSLDLLVRAYAYEGVMRLEAGQRRKGEDILVKGYRCAQDLGIGYFIDWLERVPRAYDFDVKEAGQR